MDLSRIFANQTFKQVVSASTWDACPQVVYIGKGLLLVNMVMDICQNWVTLDIIQVSYCLTFLCLPLYFFFLFPLSWGTVLRHHLRGITVMFIWLLQNVGILTTHFRQAEDWTLDMCVFVFNTLKVFAVAVVLLVLGFFSYSSLIYTISTQYLHDIYSDQWTVGVLCYVLLSGYSPFLDDDDNVTYSNVSG